MSAEPRWLAEARRHLGQREIKGARHNPLILRWWQAIRAHFTDDETPWCAGFVGGVLEAVGIKSSRSAAARSYLNWGAKLTRPALGCIVVFERGPHHGHVAFLVGMDGADPVCLGGNQGDAVNERRFDARRVLGYRWPLTEPLSIDSEPPQIRLGAGEVSRAEA